MRVPRSAMVSQVAFSAAGWPPAVEAAAAPCSRWQSSHLSTSAMAAKTLRAGVVGEGGGETVRVCVWACVGGVGGVEGECGR